MNFTPYTKDNNYWILNIEMLEVCQKKTSLFNLMFTGSGNSDYDKRPQSMEINEAFRQRLPLLVMGKRENIIFNYQRIFDFYYTNAYDSRMVCCDVWSTGDNCYRIFNVGYNHSSIDLNLLKEEVVKRYDAAYPRIKLS